MKKYLLLFYMIGTEKSGIIEDNMTANRALDVLFSLRAANCKPYLLVDWKYSSVVYRR